MKWNLRFQKGTNCRVTISLTGWFRRRASMLPLGNRLSNNPPSLLGAMLSGNPPQQPMDDTLPMVLCTLLSREFGPNSPRRRGSPESCGFISVLSSLFRCCRHLLQHRLPLFLGGRGSCAPICFSFRYGGLMSFLLGLFWHDLGNAARSWAAKGEGGVFCVQYFFLPSWGIRGFHRPPLVCSTRPLRCFLCPSIHVYNTLRLFPHFFELCDVHIGFRIDGTPTVRRWSYRSKAWYFREFQLMGGRV